MVGEGWAVCADASQRGPEGPGDVHSGPLGRRSGLTVPPAQPHGCGQLVGQELHLLAGPCGPDRRDGRAGEFAVKMMTERRGFANAKARRELGWQLRYPSWRQGFKGELA